MWPNNHKRAGDTTVQKLSVQITLCLPLRWVGKWESNQRKHNNTTFQTIYPEKTQLRHTEAHTSSALASQLCLQNIRNIGTSFWVVRLDRTYFDNLNTILEKQKNEIWVLQNQVIYYVDYSGCWALNHSWRPGILMQLHV